MKCCICGKAIHGYGNNPYHLDKREGARCCDKCNVKVIYKRLTLSEKKIMEGKDER